MLECLTCILFLVTVCMFECLNVGRKNGRPLGEVKCLRFECLNVGMFNVHFVSGDCLHV